MTVFNMTPGWQTPFDSPEGYAWDLPGQGVGGIATPSLYRDGSFTSDVPVIGGANPDPALPNTTTPLAPQSVITFDTIGQLIYSTFGYARMPLRYLWVEGINNSGDRLSGDTITFAAALCAPIDPLEEGDTVTIFDGASAIFDFVSGITPPADWDPIRQALLIASLATAVIYPGTEGQDPDPTILADKGVALTPAFRGLRYIVLQAYPATALPHLSVVWNRSNPNTPSPTGKKKKKKPTLGIAVEFAPGST